MSYMGQVDVEELLESEELFPDHLTPASPAAGAGLVFALDSRWQWRFVSVRFTLTTDVNVANRVPTVDYCDPEGNVWLRNSVYTVLAAGVTAQEYDYAIDANGGQAAATFPIVGRLSRLWLPGGWQMRVNVANVQVGDQLANFRLYVVKRLND